MHLTAPPRHWTPCIPSVNPACCWCHLPPSQLGQAGDNKLVANLVSTVNFDVSELESMLSTLVQPDQLGGALVADSFALVHHIIAPPPDPAAPHASVSLALHSPVVGYAGALEGARCHVSTAAPWPARSRSLHCCTEAIASGQQEVGRGGVGQGRW